MNIFVTNACPIISAQEHCDVHLRKLLVEVAQMLSTAHNLLDGASVGYKPTHQMHPCSIWIRSTLANYEWAARHLKALSDEYTFRTGKIHKTWREVGDALMTPPTNIPYGDLQPFAMAMPEKFQARGIFDQTKAYQVYLCEKFQEWACRAKPIEVEYTHRDKPEWLK